MAADGYFITGTDTGVGKTLVSVGLIHALRRRNLKVAGLKPVACGTQPGPDGPCNEDALALQRAGNVPLGYPQVNPALFAPPIAPHIAAAESGKMIEIGKLIDHYQSVRDSADCIIVEGVGGWQVPLNDSATSADLAQAFALPVILVVGMRLGCLNHALLTQESIRNSGLPLAAWVANAVDPDFLRLEQNVAALQKRISAPLLARIPWFAAAAPLPGRIAALFNEDLLDR